MFCPQPFQKALVYRSVITLAQALFTNLSLKPFGNRRTNVSKQPHILISRASSHTLRKKPLVFHGKVPGMHKQLHCSISSVSILRSSYYMRQRWSKGCSQRAEPRKRHPRNERMETLPLGAHLCPKTRASLLSREMRETCSFCCK